MIKRLQIILSLILLVSCARIQTLNLVQHNYSERPRNIVWIQIAGFSEEHIPLLRFNVSDANYRTNLEKVDCLGKMWSYNLYDLRPEASKSFLSQINGSKNINGMCEDYTAKSVLSSLSDLGYTVSLLETGTTAESTLEKSLKCEKNKILDLERFRYYQMSIKLNDQLKSKYFHYQDSLTSIQEAIKPGLYKDKSCQKGLCYSSVFNNFKMMWSQLSKEQNQTFFLIRDFNFLNALRKKDIGMAKESLLEYDRIIGWLDSLKRDDLLIIVTGAETINLEYPKEGKEWAEFEKSGKNIIFKNSSLMSPVMAKGPMAENFCGMFDESEMLKRIIYRPDGKKFSWDNLNPFTN